MKKNQPLVNFDWLIQDAEPSAEILNNQDIPWTKAPVPEHIGSGGYEGWFLTNGISIFHSNYTFSPKVSGQLIPLAKVTPKFSEPTIMIHTLISGRVIHQDKLAKNDLIYGDGADLFRFCEEASVTPVMDTSQDIEMISVMINESSLKALIGEAMATQLLKKLDLLPAPKVAIKAIPNYVNHSLQNCLKSQYSPSLKKVIAQARILDYLTELTKFICEDTSKKESSNKAAKKRIKDLKQYLLNLEGKLPTINALAIQFSRSARLLNEEFQNEYGDSIFNFVLNHRLNAAHEAISNTTTPLKQLAERLGYAHVNHFSSAFKKKFGYSPGSLRKK